jgi:hypothetical protein
VLLQYNSFDGHLISSYELGFGFLLNNQLLKIENNYVYFPACPNSNFDLIICPSPKLYQFRTKETPIPTVYSYKKGTTNSATTMSIEKQSSIPSTGINFAVFTKRFSDTLLRHLWQNSFFTPAIYQDQTTNTTHFLYFSGGGNIYLANCADRFVNDISISIVPDTQQIKYGFSTYRSITPANFATSDYASILIMVDGSFYYFIHGGISCNLQTIFSQALMISLDKLQYGHLLQQNQIIP